MQNQSSQWLSVRRDRPDYMIMYGWGAMNPTGVKEAARTGYPMDKFISIWWPGDDDLRATGEPAKGFKMLNWHGLGADFTALQDIQNHVVGKGKSQVASPDKVGEILYNRGVYNSMLIAEAIRNGAAAHGQEGGHRRGCPARPREPRHHRRAPEGDRHRRLRAARQALVQRP